MLYLEELGKTNDLKIIAEIYPFIAKLKIIAKEQGSFWLLAETLLFQAKLNLIIFRFEEAQKLLVQAYDIGVKNHQNRLAKRILKEQDELSNNLMKWEKLKAMEAEMSERMNLAQIGEQIEILLQKRKYLKRLTVNPNQW